MELEKLELFFKGNTVKVSEGTYREKIITIRRVAKVVKGGRRFSFSALIVLGDGKNKVGFGLGKAKEIPEAINKAKSRACKKIVNINTVGGTIPHKVVGKFGSGLVILLPAPPGTGIIANASMRAIFEVLGLYNILAKSIKTRNTSNIVKATINGLSKLILKI